jgi:uncharacterized protein (TIGR02145 family)
MKHVILSIATVVLCALGIQAQNDTVYFMKNGTVINKQSIKTADLDSMVFYNPQPGSIVDGDGNIYTSIAIGTQEWLVENLKTTRFNDGVTSLGTNFTGTAPAYAWYNNDISYKPVYGALYNWYAVDAASTGGKNICPVGWHVPTDEEWTALTTYLGGTSVAGGPMKEAGTTHWNSPNSGATNSSGFTALPGGYRYGDGTFHVLGNDGSYWSITQEGVSFAWYRSLYYIGTLVISNNRDKRYGYSVRCVKD